ncbi:putative spindle pole body component 110 [Vespula maculifrons]|uniref:Spindle pole body component 110 n=1 Tax=Vespula maculifrons TaxID=7453 RepID=A0ABD2CJU5_VESMC
MCALLEDRIRERWIYESVRRIYDIQSSSEDSLDHRKRHGRDRKASSTGNSRATRTASLFIDRLKSDFQRDDDFVPRFRTRCQRNWCPKFTTKYLCEPEEGERPTSLCRSVSKSLVSVTPKVYSIGLYEPRKRTRRKIALDNEDDRERVVEYFKRCTLLARRSLSRNEICSKKWMPNLLSSSTMSIPLISIPTEFHLPVLNEKDSVVRSKATTTNESVYYSPSLQSLLVDEDKFDRNEREERRKKVLDATFASKRFISANVETLTDQSPRKILAKDLSLEDISSNESSISNCCREFFSPIETAREARSASEEYYSENGILEDIRKRIDKDFERSSSKVEEDFEDFSYSDDSSFFDKACSFDHDHDYEIFLDPKDDLLTSIEQSKSVPIIPSTGPHRRSSKSVTSLSSALFQDDFSDLSSPRVSMSKDTFDESYDSNGPSRSSVNSIVYDEYAISHDFSFARQDISPEMDKTLSVRSLLDYTNLASVASLTSVFSISNGLTSKQFEDPIATSKNETVTPCALTLSKRKLKETFSRGGFFGREKLSEHRLVESIDSGVLTDYSRNDLHACRSTAERNANDLYTRERQELRGEASCIASDSVCSDDSLDRRVDRAVKKCTEDLVLLERRVKLKLKTVGARPETSKQNFLTSFDWSSGDECIGSISTPSLVSLTDSETT